MKKLTNSMLLAAALTALVIGCDSGSDDDADTIDAWQGADPHLIVQGTLDGEELDIALTGAAAADITTLWCRREYEIPADDVTGELDYAAGEFVEIKIDAKLADVNGEAREIELEFKQHDFTADAIGDTLTVIPRTDGVEPAADELWFEWEWYNENADELDLDPYFEEAAQSGFVILERFTGEVGDDGLMIPDNEGDVGLYAELTWSETESLVISLTANCEENKY